VARQLRQPLPDYYLYVAAEPGAVPFWQAKFIYHIDSWLKFIAVPMRHREKWEGGAEKWGNGEMEV